MGIKKILKIENVGRFKSFSSRNDDLSFRKNTLIFGYNTYGKSTLTAIFRSLKENNKDYVIGRKTFGEQDDQQIEILYDDGTSKYFSQDDWIDQNIEIFDQHFINKNVFYGDEINKEEQANLYDILISEEIKDLMKQVTKKKGQKSELETNRDKNKSGYLHGQIMSRSDFVKLKKDAIIDEKVKKHEEKVLRLENIEKIKGLIENTKFKQNFSQLESAMKETLDSSIETLVQKHINNNWNNPKHRIEFLEEGSKLLNHDGNCVFCGQIIRGDAKSLIDSIKKLFSEDYEKVKKRIHSTCNAILGLDIEKEVLSFNKYGALKMGDIDTISLIKKSLDKKIKQKKEDLNLELDLLSNSNYKQLKERLEKVEEALNRLQEEINSGKDLDEVKKELSLLKLKQERFNVWEEKCKDYITKSSQAQKLKGEIEHLNKLINKKVNKVFQENFKNINVYLKELGANFSLVKFDPKKNMAATRSHFCDYAFVFEKRHEVNPTNKRNKTDIEPEDKPHFKNTLSDSDKRLLALAFFLSKLSNDSSLGTKIVVFDDPISSFDDNRKESTTNLLRYLSNKGGIGPKQMIILTHEKSFFELVYEGFKSQELRTIKIHYNNTLQSIFKPLLAEEFLKVEFFSNIEKMKHAHENNTGLDEALTKRRKVIEHILKRKYYFYLKPETIRTKSVGTYLKEIPDDQISGDLKQKINNLKLHDEMHDRNSIYHKTDPVKVQSLQNTLSLIKLL